MRTVSQTLGGIFVAGLLLFWTLAGDVQGQGRPGNINQRNPQTTVIIHYDDGHAHHKPDHAGGPGGGGDEEPPQGDGISYSLIGGYWADDIPDNGVVDPNLTFVIDPSGFPAGGELEILKSFQTWEDQTAGTLLNLNTLTFEAGVTVAFGDGVNTYSMRNLGGGGVLAATYITWDDANGNGNIDLDEHYLEMDVIHNYVVKWAIAEDNPKGRWWDIANVATHEIGHVYGLGHSGNDEPADYEQTMYASAPARETKKRTLEAGDIEGVQHPYLGYGAP